MRRQASPPGYVFTMSKSHGSPGRTAHGSGSIDYLGSLSTKMVRNNITTAGQGGRPGRWPFWQSAHRNLGLPGGAGRLSGRERSGRVARMTPLRFRGDPRFHLFQRPGPPGPGQRSEHVFGFRRREEGRGFQQHAFGRVFHDQLRAGLPLKFLPYSLGQNDLAFGGHNRRQFLARGHDVLRRW